MYTYSGIVEHKGDLDICHLMYRDIVHLQGICRDRSLQVFGHEHGRSIFTLLGQASVDMWTMSP